MMELKIERPSRQEGASPTGGAPRIASSGTQD